MAEHTHQTLADGIKANLGNAIKEKLTETIKNADVLSMLKKIVAMTTDNEESEEVRGKLSDVLQQYETLPENEKIQFVAQMKEALTEKLSKKLQEQNVDFSGIEEAIGQAVMYNVAVVAGGVLLFIIVLVFFGYKLYRSITEKERKREEKKKAKQMKKKK